MPLLLTDLFTNIFLHLFYYVFIYLFIIYLFIRNAIVIDIYRENAFPYFAYSSNNVHDKSNRNIAVFHRYDILVILI